jgi:hypothetical protein
MRRANARRFFWVATDISSDRAPLPAFGVETNALGQEVTLYWFDARPVSPTHVSVIRRERAPTRTEGNMMIKIGHLSVAFLPKKSEPARHYPPDYRLYSAGVSVLC